MEQAIIKNINQIMKGEIMQALTLQNYMQMQMFFYKLQHLHK